jgi:hypothetical protein
MIAHIASQVIALGLIALCIAIIIDTINEAN